MRQGVVGYEHVALWRERKFRDAAVANAQVELNRRL